MKQNNNERRIRRLKAQYRRRIAIWAASMLVIGLILGIVADKLLFTPKTEGGETTVVYITPTPEAATPEPEPTAAPETDAEPTAIPETSAEPEEAQPETEASVAEDEGDIALEAEPEETVAPVETGVTLVPATVAPTPEPTQAPTEAPAEAPEVTAEPEAAEGENWTLAEAAENTDAAEAATEAPAETTTETPSEVPSEAPADTPAPTAEPTPEPTETPVPGPTVIATVPFGDSYDFSTQIKADGTARLNPEDGEDFETVSFTLTMKDYMLPSDFAAKWGSVYKLQGNEAGAGFDLTLHNYTGSATIVPQDIIKIVFQSETGNTEIPGYQLMDAEINGKTEVAVKSDTPKTLWKRYGFTNAGEEMKYLAVTTYNSGVVQTILFELKSNVAPTPDPRSLYKTLQLSDKNDAVADMQKRLIELGYLSGDADGKFGEKTEKAVKAAQKDYDMDQSGVASPEFQAMLFGEQPTPEEATLAPDATESSED